MGPVNTNLSTGEYQYYKLMQLEEHLPFSWSAWPTRGSTRFWMTTVWIAFVRLLVLKNSIGGSLPVVPGPKKSICVAAPPSMLSEASPPPERW